MKNEKWKKGHWIGWNEDFLFWCCIKAFGWFGDNAWMTISTPKKDVAVHADLLERHHFPGIT